MSTITSLMCFQIQRNIRENRRHITTDVLQIWELPFETIVAQSTIMYTPTTLDASLQFNKSVQPCIAWKKSYISLGKAKIFHLMKVHTLIFHSTTIVEMEVGRIFLQRSNRKLRCSTQQDWKKKVHCAIYHFKPFRRLRAHRFKIWVFTD